MPAARSWRAPRTRISTGVSRRLELWTARRDGGEGADLFLDPAAFREAFAADVDQATADVMAAAQRPYAAAAFAAAPSGPPAWKTLPCWYLLGTEDKAIPPALQRFMAERANATIVEVPASHVSFVSQPDAATELILHAVEATMSAAST
jgi:pimeloyl-ACP methyl ester carboxylesterase